MIAADHAVCRLLMTLSEQIKLWMINLETESMLAVGFIGGLADLTNLHYVVRGDMLKPLPPFPASSLFSKLCWNFL